MAYLSQRNARTDFPVLTVCICQEEKETRCVVGARPMPAVCIRDEEGILSQGITEESAAAFGEYVMNQIKTGSNMRASGEYRKLISKVLVKRGLLKIADMESEVGADAD